MKKNWYYCMRGGTQLTTLLPVRDGAVLPVLHLNAYKIANPTILARIDEKDFIKLFEGYGYYPYIISGDEPMQGYQQMAAMFDCIILLFY